VLRDNAKVSHSMITGGCDVDGRIENSILFSNVTVETGAKVDYSIIMPGATIKAGAVVEYSIVAENAVVGCGAHIGAPPSDDPSWGISVVASEVAVAPGDVVAPGAMCTEPLKGGEGK
jgi:glucose-1-phosphate adenylyltransferase